ncbi:hypothetical protein O3M35_007637 [Rhynocoris fuscipes]|uniref:Leucine-rich PPR motif-containing protein, mitochondrial n=1 Tax=Rhynocoris fuscipes TaxID=488301 RepID=A0AAW1DAY8_9HEMI
MSMLRSSKFVRYFVTFARNIVITQPKNVDKALLESSKRLIYGGIERTFASGAESSLKVNTIDKSIQRLDSDVRRLGRVTSKELLEVFEEIRNSRQATSTQSLMIIRCCGNLVPEESPEVRTRLVNEIWETLEKIGVPMDISHYNALLRVYLENEHYFSPTEFLSMLDKNGVEPNRVTYQRLILAYCQRGDIEGATRILEFMKDKQIPVNEGVFNALIVGHSQADDMESAAGILSVMRQANIEPSGDTYTALLCGHARRGDIDSINAIINECKQKGVELIDRDILEVAFTLAVNNNSEHLDEVLTHVRKVFGYNQDARNVILRLITKGEDDAALKILKTMPSSPNNEHIGGFLIKQMVRTNRPLDRILSLCKTLKESGDNEYALHDAIEAALVSGVNPSLSLKLLSALAAQEPVCQHYYWPVLVQYGKTKNFQDVYNTLKQMIEEVGQPVSTETLKDYVLPYMMRSNQSISDLRQGGVSVGMAAVAAVSHLVANNNLKEAANIALQYRANYNYSSLSRTLVNAFITTKDIESMVKIVRIMNENEREDTESPAEVVLQGIVNSCRGKDRIKVIRDVLQSYLENGIGISNDVAKQVQDTLNGEELTQEISTLLTNLTSSDLIPKEIVRPPSKQLNNEDNILKAIKSGESKDNSVVNLKMALLVNYCRNKELEKARNLVEKLKEEKVEFSVGILALLLDLYASHDMLSEATEIYEQLFSLDPALQIDDEKLIKYAILLVKNDKVEEALNLFKKHNPKNLDDKSFNQSSLAWRLLNTLAEKGDAKMTKEFFNTMKDKKFIEPSNVLLGPIIKAHLVNNDVTGALNEFEECCNLYRVTPWKNELACRLIQSEDAAALQRLTDLSSQVHGEMNSLHDLVLSFIECGRIRQARKILETPGLRARTRRINSACEKYTNEGKIAHLENLVEATKDLSYIDRADIYYHLLLSYSNANEVDKAMSLWTQMQDEDVQPSDHFLYTLGVLLKKHNKPVPFAIPETLPQIENEITKKEISTSKLNILRAMRKAVYAKDLDEALELNNKLEFGDLTTSDRSKLLNLLVNSGRLREGTQILINWMENGVNVYPRILSNLIKGLAKLGDVDSFDAIGKYLDQDMRKLVSFVNRRAHCMVEAGRSEEVLDKLVEDVKNAKTPEQFNALAELFPRGGLFPILNAHPEYLPRVEEMAALYRERGIVDPCNVLWIYFTKNGDETKAQEYWNYMKPSDRFMFTPLLKPARDNLDDVMIAKLLKQSREAGVRPPVLGVLYSTLMDIHLMQNRESDCEKVLDEAIQVCSIDNLSRRTLLRVKQAFEASGKEFKHTIPAVTRKTQKPAETSSSSSDSDAEEQKK